MNAPASRSSPWSRFRPACLIALGVGAFDFLSQVVLRRELAPGEFGTVNTVLGVVTVTAAPALALAVVPYRRLLTRSEAAQWKIHRPALTRLFIFGLAGIALVMLVGVLPFLVPGRFSLQMFAVLAAETALAALLGLALCRATGRYRLLAGLLLGGAVLRFAVNAVGGHFQPVAQSGVGAFLLAAALPALPALQDYHFPALGGEGRALLRKLLRPLLATTGVLGALALFTDAHRFVAQANFGFADPNLNGFVDLPGFDDFQVAGFLARGVLLLTLPPLLIFAARRAGVDRTTRESLNWFWIYLVALFTGVVLLVAAAPLADVVFTGHAGAFLRGFAAPVFVLGLVQGMGAFVLASRRWIECLVFSGAGVAYALFLYAAGHQPAVLMSCMFGGALIALMLVLAVGVVRYGRSHP